MSPRKPSRTRNCAEAEARTRLRDARAQLELAQVAGPSSAPEEIKAAVSCAVLAGIAASDAACCKALGQVNRSPSHCDAVAMLRQVAPGGPAAAKDLERLLGEKDASQYGFTPVSRQKLSQAVRRARALVSFAERTLMR